MSEDRYLELAPLAALGALDGEERAEFERHLPTCPACQAELRAHEAVVGRIGTAVSPVPPAPGLRQRVLGAVGEAGVRRGAEPHPRWLSALATAAAVAFGVGLIFTLYQRDAARRESEELRRQRDALEARAHATEQEREVLQRRLAWEASLRDLMAQPEARTTVLAGQGAASGARGRVVWSPVTREAVMVASGLEPPPPGKAYEMWVIADGPPVPAGLFHVEPDGRAAFRLPALEQMARVKTFAVTLEPTSGSPAPTSPMILSGPVS